MITKPKVMPAARPMVPPRLGPPPIEDREEDELMIPGAVAIPCGEAFCPLGSRVGVATLEVVSPIKAQCSTFRLSLVI
jgi:hypothetical protein